MTHSCGESWVVLAVSYYKSENTRLFGKTRPEKRPGKGAGEAGKLKERHYWL